MQKYPMVDKKLADWISFFNSIPSKQSQEAEILKSLILGYRAKPKRMEVIIIAKC